MNILLPMFLLSVLVMFQTMIAENDGVIDGPGSCSPEALLMGSCFQLLLQALLSIFSW